MLSVVDVSYETRGASLLSDIAFEAEAGRLVAIIGPNGAGKSTLLKVMAGELAPTKGRVELAGANIAGLKPSELAAKRAVVPQATHLGFPFTAAEVVALGHSVPGFAGDVSNRAAIVAAALQQVEMSALANRSYELLSGGERQRVHFARALCQMASARPGAGQILMLDEATSNLDLSHQLLVLAEAGRLAKKGSAIVAVMHDWNLAARFADDMLVLSQGRVAAFGTPSEVLTDQLLSTVFNCGVRCNKVPMSGTPFVLPQLCSVSVAP
jgi:heme transport system ATP-binding protein